MDNLESARVITEVKGFRTTRVLGISVGFNDELSINNGEYTGYAEGLNKTHLTICNYDDQLQQIKINKIKELKNCDTSEVSKL